MGEGMVLHVQPNPANEALHACPQFARPGSQQAMAQYQSMSWGLGTSGIQNKDDDESHWKNPMFNFDFF